MRHFGRFFNNVKNKEIYFFMLSSEGFRCGVFFAGEKTEDPPIETIMVLPRRFAMDCTQPPAKQQELGQEECFDLFRIITSKINVRSKSRRNPGNTIGDDLCDRLKISGMKRVPGPGHPKPEFRDGMKVGFFYNTCTDTKWYNTGLEIPEQVCCQKKTWKNIPCP